MSSIAPQDEAAVIFVRLFESLARRSGATLKPTTRADIARACELLSHAGETYDLLDDLLEHTPPRREYTTVNFSRDAESDAQYQAWKRRREERVE